MKETHAVPSGWDYVYATEPCGWIRVEGTLYSTRPCDVMCLHIPGGGYLVVSDLRAASKAACSYGIDGEVYLYGALIARVCDGRVWQGTAEVKF